MVNTTLTTSGNPGVRSAWKPGRPVSGKLCAGPCCGVDHPNGLGPDMGLNSADEAGQILGLFGGNFQPASQLHIGVT